MSFYKFRNCILILYLKEYYELENLNFILHMYQFYFKKIIVYSINNLEAEKYIDTHLVNISINHLDVTEKDSSDDNTVNEEIHKNQKNMGIKNINTIFVDFYQKYKISLRCSNGLFFTTLDNIINLNILENYRNDKIIYFFHDIHNLILPEIESNNIKMKNGNLNLSCGKFFYLPEKYLDDKLFSFFELFRNMNISTEISIPFLINLLDKNKNNFQRFYSLNFPEKEKNKFNCYTYFREVILRKHNLFLNPLDLNYYFHAKKWILDIHKSKKCVIITTINIPTEAIIKHIDNPDYEVIIIGDLKTPNTYRYLNCIYLDLENQNILFPELSKLIPVNHYSRKNLGYLYAINKGFEIIYETDDDNIPLDNFEKPLKIYEDIKDNSSSKKIKYITERDDIWINIFSYYTCGKHIWPRGFPISKVNKKSNFSFQTQKVIPSIICGMIEGEPDVDAIFRLTNNHEKEPNLKWRDEAVIVNNKNMCVFNTQNTFWVNPELFFSLYIPSTVSFRYTDILRGIITNHILKLTDNHLMFSGINVKQIRNEHDLKKDFESEQEMYLHNENIIGILNQVEKPTIKCIYLIQASSKLPEIYDCFREKGNFILLSYKEEVEDTHIFLPNSTWTSGRNKLREYILENNTEDYDYFIFLDEDIQFENMDNKTGFEKFEEYLNLYRPEIGAPRMNNYVHYDFLKYKVTNSLFFDGICNAFHKSIINSPVLFPWDEYFDNKNWWMSQNMQCIKCFIFNFDVIIFTELHLDNIQHNSYTRENCFSECFKYCFEKCLEIDPDCDLGLFEYVKHISYNHNPTKKEFEKYYPKFKKSVISSKYYYDYFKNIYQKLVEKNIVQDCELEMLDKWLEYFY